MTEVEKKTIGNLWHESKDAIGRSQTEPLI